MATVQREIETKYDVSAAVALPDLRGLPRVAAIAEPAEHDLEAVYFDTPDLALARAKVTLRRRTGGDDAGWHLKRPLTGGDREERRLPLGRARTRVPAELVALVRVHVRAQRLVPVATLRNHRVVHRLLDAEGAVLAEVCDDRVEGLVHADGGSSQTWREWEVELGTGDRSLLDDAGAVLSTAGARPADGPSKLSRVLGDRLKEQPAGETTAPRRKGPAGPVVLAHLREQVAELQARDPEARLDVPDGVHRMRVATRRLRSALSTFRPLLDRDVTDPLRVELAWLAGALGQARDAEVMHTRISATLAAVPAELVLGPVARRVALELDDTSRRGRAHVGQTLEDTRYLTLLDALDRLLDDPPWTDLAHEPARTVLTARVHHAWKRLHSEVHAARDADTPAGRDHLLHEARKSAKRLRYAAEALAPVFGAPAERFGKTVRTVQEELGEHQDSVVARDVLRGMGAQAHLAGENAFTFGLLHAREQASADRAEQRFEAAWPATKDPRLRHWLTR